MATTDATHSDAITTACLRPAAGSSVPGPNRLLVSAALAGLMAGSLAACDSDAKDGAEGAGGAVSEASIVASESRPDLTLDVFTAECDEVGGTVELHATCGGVNSCQGFSYDDATYVFTEHTCRGLNTCSGYSCVVPAET